MKLEWGWNRPGAMEGDVFRFVHLPLPGGGAVAFYLKPSPMFHFTWARNRGFQVGYVGGYVDVRRRWTFQVLRPFVWSKERSA